MGERLIRIVVAGWGLLLATAAGGFVGANFAGIVAGSISFATAGERAPDPAPVQWWMHCGWFVGAGLFLAAGIVHYAKKARRAWADDADAGQASATSSREQHQPESGSNRFRVTVDGRPCGVLGAIGVGAIGGALLGLMLGGSLLLLWFSITYSPFAPDDWSGSVSIERQRVDGTAFERRAVTTRHPVALYAMIGPIVLGAAGGGLLAGTGTAIQKLRDRVSSGDEIGS